MLCAIFITNLVQWEVFIFFSYTVTLEEVFSGQLHGELLPHNVSFTICIVHIISSSLVILIRI